MNDLKTRLDGWLNTLSGLGGPNDRSRATAYQSTQLLGYQTSLSLYDQDWLARRIVDVFPEQALRRGFRLKEPNAQVMQRWGKINTNISHPDGLFQHALSMGRLCGGAAILIGARDSRSFSAPLADGAQVDWIDVVLRGNLQTVSAIKDPSDKDVGMPDRYKITGGRRRGLEVHHSRLVICEGLFQAASDQNIATQTVLEGPPEWPWQSVLAPVFQTLANYGLSWAAVSHLIQEASVGVMKMRGVTSMISQEDQSVAEARLRLMSVARSVTRTIFLDSEGGESFERSNVSFSDLPQLMSEMNKLISGASLTPLTILFGYTPSGLNATGESDLQQFYDRIEAYRTALKPKLEKLLSLVAGAPVEVEFDSLWQPTDLERADLQSKKFASYKTLWDMAALEGGEIVLALSEQGQLGIDLPPETVARIKTDLVAVKEPNAPTLPTPAEIPTNPTSSGAPGQDPE
jgi:phage-related protein (TIGR01555 family)